jgi:hypothetical protein
LVLVIAANRLAPVAPVQHMINCFRIFDSGFSGHASILPKGRALSTIM